MGGAVCTIDLVKVTNTTVVLLAVSMSVHFTDSWVMDCPRRAV